MSISTYLTYLTFDGNCREAFEFYRSVFGGELQLSTFAEAPAEMQAPEEEKDRVMHVSLPIGSSVLMGSDTSSFAPPLVTGNNFSLSINVDSREQCDELFAKLSAGGTVTMALQETFWGAYFGSFTDRFGINWMVSYELTQG